MSATASRIRVESVDRMLFRCFMQDLEDEARVYSFFAHCDLVVYFRHSLNFFLFCFVKGSRTQGRFRPPWDSQLHHTKQTHTEKMKRDEQTTL